MRAILAGTVMALVMASTGRAKPGRAPDEAAMAVPRAAPHGAAGVALPQPLSPAEAVRTRRVFDLIRRGDLATAAAETAPLADSPLLGTLLAARYLGHGAQPGGAELKEWLARYAVLPDAPAIHALLAARLAAQASGTPLPPRPEAASLPAGPASTLPAEESDPAARSLARDPALDRSVARLVHAGHTDRALQAAARGAARSAEYGAQLRAEVARGLFAAGRDAETLAVAEDAMRAAPKVGLGSYVAGLAAWRLGRLAQAQTFFERAAEAPVAPPSLQAAAAFWAARTHARLRDAAGYVPWMSRAARQSRTFYGLLARRILGLDAGFAWDRATLAEADVDAIGSTPEGRRAFALLQLGQKAQAEAELRLLWPQLRGEAARRALYLVARTGGLGDLAAQTAVLVQANDRRARDDERFPLRPLQPAGGFVLDRSLVYALVRVESNFDVDAVSPVGARGLMQVMPGTAEFLGGKAPPRPAAIEPSDDPDAAPAELASAPAESPMLAELRDPALNLRMGQRLLVALNRMPEIGGNLIRLLAGYNAGAGNLARWGDLHDGGDPLLFIEAIPLDETRSFVPRVLATMWVYAARLRLPSPSLDELAAGAWPRFQAAGGPGLAAARGR